MRLPTVASAARVDHLGEGRESYVCSLPLRRCLPHERLRKENMMATPLCWHIVADDTVPDDVAIPDAELSAASRAASALRRAAFNAAWTLGCLR